MKTIIISLLFMLAASFYFLEVSKLQAKEISIYSITFEDLHGNTVSKRHYAEGADLSLLELPVAPDLDGYLFIGWSISLPETMPGHSMIIEAIYMRTTSVTFKKSMGS